MRRYLGEDESAPIRHPAIVSGMRTRIMGIRLPERKGATAATIVPSVGCPMGMQLRHDLGVLWRQRERSSTFLRLATNYFKL
jgi:hypothetical protein